MPTIGEFRKQKRNANKHTERGLKLLSESVERDGWIGALTVAADGETFDGSARLVTAQQDSRLEPIVVHTTGDKPVIVVRDDIPTADDPKAKRLGVLANHVTAVDWEPDAAVLAEIAQDDAVIAALAKEDARLAELLRGEAKQEPKDAGELVDKAAELQAKWNVQRGDVWTAGKHRVMCGDSTNAADVATLMGEEKARLFATDPPYGADAGNIGFTAQRDELEAITNDNLKDTKMQEWLEGVFGIWKTYLEKDAAWYLWHPMLTQGYFAAAAAAAAADVIIHRQIIWVKEQFIFGRGDYHWQHELCFYGWVKGNRPPFYGKRNQSTVWNIPYGVRRSEIGHPTAKPPELWHSPINNHTKQGEICAEPFCGSGSQLVACEQTGRSGRGMEIEPKYVAVTLERLSGLGLTPQRITRDG